MELLNWLCPQSLNQNEFWLLIGLSVLTSAMTAIMGVGGGATLLAVMANIMPASAVIPVHAVVQLGSNIGRMATMRQHVHWSLTGWFTLGCVAGSLIGGQIVVTIPTAWLKLILGCFILWSCWASLNIRIDGKSSGATLGAVTSFLAMFVGVTGSFVIASLRNRLKDRLELIGTMAALMTVQHFVKVVVFGLFGFLFADWVGLILLMIGAGLIGTVIGKYVLEWIPNRHFSIALRVVITFLSLKLIYEGAQGLL